MKKIFVVLTFALLVYSTAWASGCMDGKTLVTQDGNAVTFTEDATVSPSGGVMTLWCKSVAYKFPYSDADCPIVEIMTVSGWKYYLSFEGILFEITGNYIYTESH